MDSGWEEVYAAQYHRLVALVAAVVDDPEGWLYRVAVYVDATKPLIDVTRDGGGTVTAYRLPINP